MTFLVVPYTHNVPIKMSIRAIPRPVSRYQLVVNDLTLDSNEILIHLQVRGAGFYNRNDKLYHSVVKCPGNKRQRSRALAPVA